MISGRTHFWLVLISIGLVCPILIIFLLSLRTASSDGITGGIGSLLGGILGALGAAWAVYLTLAGQRHEDRKRIHDAIVMEIIEFSRIVVGHLATCENIRAGIISVPVIELPNLLTTPSPIIYPAVADRLGVLKSPQKVAAFYTRLTEVSTMADRIANAVPYIGHTLNGEHIKLLTEALVDICQFALMVINDSGDKAFDKAVTEHMLSELSGAMQTAREKFSIPLDAPAH
jgi:hypothetical protein